MPGAQAGITGGVIADDWCVLDPDTASFASTDPDGPKSTSPFIVPFVPTVMLPLDKTAALELADPELGLV